MKINRTVNPLTINPRVTLHHAFHLYHVTENTPLWTEFLTHTCEKTQLHLQMEMQMVMMFLLQRLTQK